MTIVELTTKIKRTIFERQNGMCAYTGKKFENFEEAIEINFIAVNEDSEDHDEGNVVMV
jgi:hypothetical protein